MNRIRLIGFCMLLCFQLTVTSSIFAGDKKDVSTSSDWKTNCSLHNEYHNKLIFSAVETTTASGKRQVMFAARNRTQYLSVFKKLKLDSVPSLKAQRDRIVNMAEKAQGGSSVAISPEMDRDVRDFWKKIAHLVKQHGVSCKSVK